MSDRKYQHSGYRSEPKSRERPARRTGEGAREGERSAPRPPQPPHSRDAPRGRGLGAPTEATFRCARCGEAAPIATAQAFAAKCAGCGGDLHTCSNCTAFDPGARFECRREIPARVSPKDRANRCELFDPRTRQEFAQEKPKPAAGNRSAFDALFKS
jgi:hypothetical protein